MQVQNIEKRDMKNIVDESTQKKLEDFQKSITGKDTTNDNEKTDIINAFNENSTVVLRAIQTSMINNFMNMDTEKLKTYTQATNAFEQDIAIL